MVFLAAYAWQALGQLLDYAASTSPSVDAHGLVPAQPSAEDVKLLHHYGIDRLYRSTSGQFHRLAATADRRSVWRR
jgi:hypothetical protein